MTLKEKLRDIQRTKNEIAFAIEEKGVEVTSEVFSDYPDFIRQIDGGGGVYATATDVIKNIYFQNIPSTIYIDGNNVLAAVTEVGTIEVILTNFNGVPNIVTKIPFNVFDNPTPKYQAVQTGFVSPAKYNDYYFSASGREYAGYNAFSPTSIGLIAKYGLPTFAEFFNTGRYTMPATYNYWNSIDAESVKKMEIDKIEHLFNFQKFYETRFGVHSDYDGFIIFSRKRSDETYRLLYMFTCKDSTIFENTVDSSTWERGIRWESCAKVEFGTMSTLDSLIEFDANGDITSSFTLDFSTNDDIYLNDRDIVNIWSSFDIKDENGVVKIPKRIEFSELFGVTE